jgi:hypothetical protein
VQGARDANVVHQAEDSISSQDTYVVVRILSHQPQMLFFKKKRLTRIHLSHISHDVRMHHASSRRDERPRAWGEVGAGDEVTFHNRRRRGTNPSPWSTEGEVGEGSGGCSGCASRSRTTREGIVSLPVVRDANAVRLLEDSISSHQT